MGELVLFKSFYEREEAEGLHDFLQGKGIYSRIENSRALLDTVYIGHTGDKTILLLMAQSDFRRANQLIDEEIESRIGEIGPDYYLHDMTDDELLEIIRKPDEWNNQDVLIAKSLLSERGKDLTDTDIQEKKTLRIRELAKPQGMSPAYIFLSYALSLWFPLYGIVFALLLLNATTLLPNGLKVRAYTEKTRNHGWVVLVISISLSIVLFVNGVLVSSSLIREPLRLRFH